MNIKTIITLLSIAFAAPTVRYQQKPVQLYAQTGQYMTIRHSGVVKPIRGRPSLTSLIDIIPVAGEAGEFVLRGLATGLYVNIKKNRKLQAVPFSKEATHFVEEMISENNFNTYRLKSNPNCRLTTSNNQFKIQCHHRIKMKKMSFLPRRTHLRLHLQNRGLDA